MRLRSWLYPLLTGYAVWRRLRPQRKPPRAWAWLACCRASNSHLIQKQARSPESIPVPVLITCLYSTVANFAIVISWAAITGIMVGLVSPKKSLFWYPGEQNRTNVLIIYSFLLLMSFIVFAVTG